MVYRVNTLAQVGFILVYLSVYTPACISMRVDVRPWACVLEASCVVCHCFLESEELPAYHPLRVDSVASYVSFLHQDMEQRKEALDLARAAFKEAADELDMATDEDFPGAVKAIRSLLKLISWWSSENKRVLISTSYV